MVFNSYIFILLFLPLAVSGYFLLNKLCGEKGGQAGLLWLVGMSLWFYAYDIPVFLLLLLGSIIVNYLIGRTLTNLKKSKENKIGLQKAVMVTGVVLNLVPLLFFKYTNFFLDSIRTIYDSEWYLEVAMPLGISFFTFMQIAYIVDCYREENGFDYTFLEYTAYAAFFPKITMGPIVLHSEIIPQLRDTTKKKADYHNLSCGLYAFAMGLGKKVLLADTLAKIVACGFISWPERLNSLSAIVVMVSYTLQLYFDFSGYCDMAVGIARMLNIELPYNFNSPYKAKSISEFWERWHMTLTRFFTRYVYIPLGGSRKGKIRTYLNTMIVFLLSGLWHGANWTFVVWGVLHGTLMTVEKIGKDLGIGFKKLTGIPRKIVDLVRWCATFFMVNIAWMYFKAKSVGHGTRFIRRIFSGGWTCSTEIVTVFEDILEFRVLKRLGLSGILEYSIDATIVGTLVILVLSTVLLKNTQEKMAAEKYNLVRSIFSAMILVWCIISLSDISVFLYFNF